MKILLTILFCVSNLLIFAQNDNRQNENFENYINYFHSISLPLVLDRKAVFETATYRTDKYQKFTVEYRSYIPSDLINGTEICNFRYLFALAPRGNQIPLIIAKDYFEYNEQSRLELYLIIYDKKGTILDFLDIAGFIIDARESFVTIKADYELFISRYQFRFLKESKYPNLMYADESIKSCKIDKNGKMKCDNQITTTGYFEGDWIGYKLIHKE